MLLNQRPLLEQVLLIVIGGSVLTFMLIFRSDVVINAANNANEAVTSFDYQRIYNEPLSFITLHNVAYIYLFGMIVAFIYGIAHYLLAPMNSIFNFFDPWTKTDSRKGRYKQPGGMPPAFPNGWFRAIDSVDLKHESSSSSSKQILRDTILGRDLAFFRDSQENVRCLFNSCVNCSGLLSEGVVVGDGIRCAGAGAGCGRLYRGIDGKRMKEDGSEPTDDDAVGFMYTCEFNGEIYVWNDAENRAPQWEVHHPKEMNDGNWSWHGRTQHILTAHIAEMPENGADLAHLNYLHTDFLYPSLGSVLSHRWIGTWSCGERNAEDQHQGYLKLEQSIMFLKKYAVPGTTLNVNVIQQGLGLVFLNFKTLLGELYVIETVTPIHPLMQKYHHTIWAEWKIPRFVGKFVLNGLVLQAERDVPIWNYKTYINKPMVVPGDGPLVQFRRWVRTNFSENSEDLCRSLYPDIYSEVPAYSSKKPITTSSSDE